MTSKSEVFDPELKEQAPPSDLHSLRSVDEALDVRARKIQEQAFQQAVETLQKENDTNTLSKMKILVTGAAGYLGMPLVKTLRALGAFVVGLDVVSGECVDIVGSVADRQLVLDLGKKVDAIMHAGALHAPYASKYSEQQFVEVNVGGTANVLACGIPTVFTSTTSHTITNGVKVKEGSGECVWFDGNLSGTENEFTENFADQPRNKYGRTKREAERLCLAASKIQESSDFSTQNSSESSVFSTQNSSGTEMEVKKKGQSVLVLRAPRFFCEDVLPSEGQSQSSSSVIQTMPQLMAIELLGRRAALTDVITAHVKGLLRIDELNGRILTLCAPWPWSREDTPNTAVEVVKLVKTRFSEYKWPLPLITRVYDSKPAMAALDWVPKWSFQRVLSEFESDSVQQGIY